MAARTYVITGASKGIGLATALRFARIGANIVAVARNEEQLGQAVEQITEAGAAGCAAVAADISAPDEARQVITAALERFDGVDVLVNNAGRAPLMNIEEFSEEEFDQTAALNMAAIFHLTKAAWGPMKQRGGGVIVNLSSRASVDPLTGFAVYGASKAWVNTFSYAMAAEGAAHNIRVYSVAPGAVETGMMRACFPDFPADKALDPDEVAAVIESLCDERMARASGETILVRK